MIEIEFSALSRQCLNRRISSSTQRAKEVFAYAKALKVGSKYVKSHDLIHTNLLIRIQRIIEENQAGIRKIPGTELRNDLTGEVVYVPPQNHDEIVLLLSNLEKFINQNDDYELDPLVKMAIIHHQFESIHPFYDGNGRTGRILNILYLIKCGLIHLPVLYISRYIIQHRSAYYQLLQETRLTQNWEPWILYMLDAVEVTARDTIVTITEIKRLMLEFKKRIRSEEPKIYSQDLINNLFRHPYTKIGYLMKELGVSRITATKYLERLVEMNILIKVKVGRSNFYINEPLFDLLKKPIAVDSGKLIKTVRSK
jgi:Fic family protein